VNCVMESCDFLYACEGDIATDDRSYEMHLANAMDVASTNVYFYPRLIAIVSGRSVSLCRATTLTGLCVCD